MSTVKLMPGTPQQDCVDGAANVRPVSAVGAVFCAFMTAPVDQPDAAGTEIWNNTTGAKLIEIFIVTTPTSPRRIIVGWSTTSGDTSVEIDLLAALTAAGVEYANQKPLTLGVPYAQIAWDGTTTIKRVSVISETGAVLYALVATY